MLAQRLRCNPPHFFLMSRFSGSRGQITEHLPAPVFDHPFRHIQNSGKDATHAAAVVANRAVRKGEVTLLKVVVTENGKHLAAELAGLLTV
jgi:hypothetical protein